MPCFCNFDANLDKKDDVLDLLNKENINFVLILHNNGIIKSRLAVIITNCQALFAIQQMLNVYTYR